jgi:hypothetical protein
MIDAGSLTFNFLVAPARYQLEWLKFNCALVICLTVEFVNKIMRPFGSH